MQVQCSDSKRSTDYKEKTARVEEAKKSFARLKNPIKKTW